jgi:hypothetical protein
VPIRAALPASVLLWSASAPLPLLAVGSDGDLSRLAGLLLVLWAVVAIGGIAYAGRSLPGSEVTETILPRARQDCPASPSTQ